MTAQIIQGDCLDVLRTLESESVQTCVTSPPYYGLRSYKTEPVIWDAEDFCDHEFASEVVNNDLRIHGKKSATFHGGHGHLQSWQSERGFCQLCNAWRGELGLEPTFQLYISHLLQIFAEVKRVLKPDGTCFVNLGDSYAGSPVGTFNGGSDLLKGRNLDGHKSLTAASKAQVDKSKMDIRPKSLMNIPARFTIGMTDNPYTLRPDLSEEERVYVANELVKCGII